MVDDQYVMRRHCTELAVSNACHREGMVLSDSDRCEVRLFNLLRCCHSTEADEV